MSYFILSHAHESIGKDFSTAFPQSGGKLVEKLYVA